MAYCRARGGGAHGALVRGSVVRGRELAFFTGSAGFAETAQPITDVTDSVATDVKGFVSRGARSEPDRAAGRHGAILRRGRVWGGPCRRRAAPGPATESGSG